MGWWAHGLFEGDAPLDFIGEVEKWFEDRIDQAKKNGWDAETIPAIIYVYADFCRRYGRRSERFATHFQWLSEYQAIDWRHTAERKAAVQGLADELNRAFCLNKEGYVLDPGKFPKVNIVNSYVYHLTKREHADNILKEGLLPKECHAGFFGKNMNGVYVSKSLLGCMKWQHHVLGFTLEGQAAIVKFLVREEDQVYQDQRVDFKDDFVVTNGIDPIRCSILW